MSAVWFDGSDTLLLKFDYFHAKVFPADNNCGKKVSGATTEAVIDGLETN